MNNLGPTGFYTYTTLMNGSAAYLAEQIAIKEMDRWNLVSIIFDTEMKVYVAFLKRMEISNPEPVLVTE